MTSDPSRSGSDAGNAGGAGAALSRLRDKVIWVLAALIVLCVVAHFVARDYYFNNAAFDCFPYCTFKQDLSNNVAGGAPMVAVLLAVVVAVRWVRLGRRRSREA